MSHPVRCTIPASVVLGLALATASVALAQPVDTLQIAGHWSAGAPSGGDRSTPWRTLWYAEPFLGLTHTDMEGDPAVREAFDGESTAADRAEGGGYSMGAGFVIGARFSRFFGLDLELAYDTRHVSGQRTMTIGCDNSAVGLREDYSMTIHYMSLSLRPRVNLGPFVLTVAPRVLFPLGEIVDDRIRIDRCAWFLNTPDATSEVHGELGTAGAVLRVALMAACGVEIPLSRAITLVPALQYEAGISDSFESAARLRFESPRGKEGYHFILKLNDEIRLNSTRITMGLRIALNPGVGERARATVPSAPSM